MVEVALQYNFRVGVLNQKPTNYNDVKKLVQEEAKWKNSYTRKKLYDFFYDAMYGIFDKQGNTGWIEHAEKAWKDRNKIKYEAADEGNSESSFHRQILLKKTNYVKQFRRIMFDVTKGERIMKNKIAKEKEDHWDTVSKCGTNDAGVVEKLKPGLTKEVLTKILKSTFGYQGNKYESMHKRLESEAGECEVEEVPLWRTDIRLAVEAGRKKTSKKEMKKLLETLIGNMR